MTTGKILLLVFGALIMMGAVGFLICGGFMVWFNNAFVDSEGFLDMDPVTLESDSYAIVANVDVAEYTDGDGMAMMEWLGMDAIKVEGISNDPSKQIFIGVAEESDVSAYLDDVAYYEIEEIVYLGSSKTVDYISYPGGSVPEAPTEQTFWAVYTHGVGTQELEWSMETGSYSFVLMNADGLQGIDMDVVPKIKLPPFIMAMGVAFIVIGALALIAGSVMLYFGLRSPREPDVELSSA